MTEDRGWLYHDDCWSAAMGRHNAPAEQEPPKPAPQTSWRDGLIEERPGVWVKHPDEVIRPPANPYKGGSTMPRYGLPPDNKTYTTSQTEASLAWVRYLELQRAENAPSR